MKYFFQKNKILLVIGFIVLWLCLICVGWTIYNKNKNKNQGNNYNNKKIACCFLIYDTINHEELWKKFFDGVDKNKYNIYIHYKDNTPLKYFEKHKLNNCVDTEWGTISLVKASNLLFKTAYDHDNENYKFVLLSNSCIPLKGFDKIYNKLTSNDYGYLNASEDVNNKNCKIYKENPKKYGKASQWIILNREMVKETAFHDDTWIDSNFGDVFAPDEIYYYTMLKHKNMENQLIIASNSATKGSTFVYWPDMADYPYSYEGNSSPRAYDTISSEELIYLLNQPCLFGRKFNQNCKVLMNDEYKKIEDVIEYWNH
jgi:hypothetical protein